MTDIAAKFLSLLATIAVIAAVVFAMLTSDRVARMPWRTQIWLDRLASAAILLAVLAVLVALAFPDMVIAAGAAHG